MEKPLITEEQLTKLETFVKQHLADNVSSEPHFWANDIVQTKEPQFLVEFLDLDNQRPEQKRQEIVAQLGFDPRMVKMPRSRSEVRWGKPPSRRTMSLWTAVFVASAAALTCINTIHRGGSVAEMLLTGLIALGVFALTCVPALALRDRTMLFGTFVVGTYVQIYNLWVPGQFSNPWADLAAASGMSLAVILIMTLMTLAADFTWSIKRK